MSTDENTWLPLSNISTTTNELLECFHWHYPRAPCLHQLIISRALSTDPSILNSQTPMPVNSKQLLPSISISSCHTPSPHSSPLPNLINAYVPPTQITTRSGRIICPAPWLDPHIPGWWRPSLRTSASPLLINTPIPPLSLLMKILALTMKNNLHTKEVI